jgi:hypothetical protein
MTHTQIPGVAAQPAPFLGERENQRAVDLIESAERAAPYCPCGSHMVAVSHDTQVWLECAELSREKQGLSGAIARLTSWTHARSMIMETSGN